MSTTSNHPESALEELGLTLPEMATSRANYRKAVRSGNLVFLSGHGPIKDDKHVFLGKLGRDLDVEQGQAAAQLVMLNMLATLKAEIGDLDRVSRFVKFLVFVNSDPDFVETHRVANGASDLLDRMFGPERAPHARSAVGMATLPFGISVEIEGIVEVAD